MAHALEVFTVPAITFALFVRALESLGYTVTDPEPMDE